MSLTLTFCSAKGGVGKTTSAVNLAAALAGKGGRVLLIDLDAQGALDRLVGLPTPGEDGLSALFCSPHKPVEQIAVPAPACAGLYCISSAMRDAAQERKLIARARNSMQLRERLLRGAMDYDFIVLDTPAYADALTRNAILAADFALLPMPCEPLALSSFEHTLRRFAELDAPNHPAARICGLLISLYDPALEVHRQVEAQLRAQLGTMVFEIRIPRAEEALHATVQGLPVTLSHPQSPLAAAYLRLATELLERLGLRTSD